MFQDEDGEIKLIKLVYENPIIYDRRRSDYKNNTKKTEAWNYVAASMGETVTEVQRAWRLLRERFARERRNLKLLRHSTTEIIESKWPLFESLLFLDRHVKGRRTSGKIINMQSTTESIPSEQDLSAMPTSPLFLSVKLPSENSELANNSNHLKMIEEVDMIDYVKVEPNDEDYLGSGAERTNTPSSSSSELIQSEPLSLPTSSRALQYEEKSQISQPPKKKLKEYEPRIQECLKTIETYFRGNTQMRSSEAPDYFGLYIGQKLRSMSPTTRSRKEKEIVLLLNS